MANSKEIHLAGEVLDRAWHICALFHSQEEAYRVLLPFIRQGFDQGDRAAHIVDPREREEHLRRLQQAGIDVAEAERRDQLVVRSWDNAYLQDGIFDPDRTIRLAEELLLEGRARGFELTRLIARMEWALQDPSTVEQVVEHEVRLNQALQKHGDVICCTYDVNTFSDSVVMDVLRTQPVVLIGEILHRNPFFVQPEELLRELRERSRPSDSHDD